MQIRFCASQIVTSFRRCFERSDATLPVLLVVVLDRTPAKKR